MLPGACRGVKCEAAFSPTFSTTPFSPTFGATPKILSATPNFRLFGVALGNLGVTPKVGEKGVALKVGEKAASHFTLLHAPSRGLSAVLSSDHLFY